jgi:hypothetical protein
MAARDFMTLEDILGGPVPAYLTVKEIARIFRIDVSTARRRCEEKAYRNAYKLPAAGRKPDGEWRIPSRFLEQQIREAEKTGEFAP